jgi:hypothetical protein
MESIASLGVFVTLILGAGCWIVQGFGERYETFVEEPASERRELSRVIGSWDDLPTREAPLADPIPVAPARDTYRDVV